MASRARLVTAARGAPRPGAASATPRHHGSAARRAAGPRRRPVTCDAPLSCYRIRNAGRRSVASAAVTDLRCVTVTLSPASGRSRGGGRVLKGGRGGGGGEKGGAGQGQGVDVKREGGRGRGERKWREGRSGEG